MIYLFSISASIFTVLAKWLWGFPYVRTCSYLLTFLIIMNFSETPIDIFPYVNFSLLISTLLYCTLTSVFVFLLNNDQLSPFLDKCKGVLWPPLLVAITAYAMLIAVKKNLAYLALNLAITLFISYLFFWLLSHLVHKYEKSSQRER